MFLSQPALWGPPDCSALCVPLILKDQGAVKKPLPPHGKLRHGICMKSIRKRPCLAFRHAPPSPHPFQTLKNVHRSLFSWRLKSDGLSHCYICPAWLSGAQRAPHGPGPPRGGHAAPSPPRHVVQASSSPSPSSRKIPITDSPSGLAAAQLSRSKESITPGSSLLSLRIHLLPGKFLQDQGHWPRRMHLRREPLISHHAAP